MTKPYLRALPALTFASIACAQPFAEPRPYDGQRIVRVEMESLRDVRTLHALSDDPWTCGWDGVSPGQVDFRVTAGAYEALRASGVRYRVLIDDVQALVDSERRAPEPFPPLAPSDRGPSWYSAYQPLAAVSARVDALVAGSMGRASRLSIGRSVEDRELFAIRISSGPATGGGDKPAIVINGCQHAREWITVMATMHLAERLLNDYGADATITRVADAFDWYIVPVSNVDGYLFSWTSGQRFWRKNRRDNGNSVFGVDNNRNWDSRWGTIGTSTSTNSDVYCGPSAFSEPETRALRDLLAARAAAGGLALHVDVHSFSQLILEPVGYDWTLPRDTAVFSALSLTMQQAMFAVESKVYFPGPIYRNIYPVGGGSCDWTYDALDALGMSFELRDEGQTGFALPADQIVPTSRECGEGLLAAAVRLLDHPVGIDFVNGVPTRVLAEAQTAIQVRTLRGLSKPDSAAPVVLRQRVGRTGPFAGSSLGVVGTDEAGPVLEGLLTGGPCGSIVQFYFEVPTLGGGVQTVPVAGAAGPFESPAQTFASIYATTFDTATAATGWLAGATGDTATTGQWTRGDPSGTTAQAEFDRTPLTGSDCFYTGMNMRGSTSNGDVDGGFTTLLSPLFDLASVGFDAEFSFWLWYSNARSGATTADDAFRVEITGNATAPTPTWTPALTLQVGAPIAQATGVWRKYSFRAAPLGVLTSQARLRFIASDQVTAGTVEAALDDFAVTALTCVPAPCPADWNGSGAASVQDVFDFLAAYFASEPGADVNRSGSISVQDVFDFLTLYFLGC